MTTINSIRHWTHLDYSTDRASPSERCFFLFVFKFRPFAERTAHGKSIDIYWENNALDFKARVAYLALTISFRLRHAWKDSRLRRRSIHGDEARANETDCICAAWAERRRKYVWPVGASTAIWPGAPHTGVDRPALKTHTSLEEKKRTEWAKTEEGRNKKVQAEQVAGQSETARGSFFGSQFPI